ncbi:MAG TPA: (Fe-S)-binding protein [Verrucomicrobiae bacterium]|nr:(Fe-S)-binding protein [Verrucomicrobiae bacterium]
MPDVVTASHRQSHLKDLDYSVVQQCMHCGLCLPTCPTYDATRLERNSPRGRIALMRAIADDRLDVTKAFGEEMYFCLGCLACQTACPAGVNYAELFEHARAEIEDRGVLNSTRRSLIRNFTLRWLFMDLRRLELAGKALRLYQQTGLQTLIRRSGVLKLLSGRLRELEAMTPAVCARFSADLIANITPAIGPKKYRVAMLTGCAQDLTFSDVNRDTVEVLARNGCEVYTPPEQNCCGSLHAHNGEWPLAQTLARRNIEQFPPEQFDAIITNAGGCGSHLKHYAKLLADELRYADRAKLWDEKVKDVHEWLIQIGVRPPQVTPSPLNGERAGVRGGIETEHSTFNTQHSTSNSPAHPSPSIPLPVEGRGKPAVNAPAEFVVTYHESCHLTHGQKVVSQPRELLRAIPGLKLVELPEANWCCGSAGIYNLTQPEMAGELLHRKIRHIKSTGATVVATGNPGCLLQLLNGAAKEGLTLRVVHPITLLAEAYRAENSR